LGGFEFFGFWKMILNRLQFEAEN